MLTDTPGDPLMTRIRAEVVSLGLDVLVRPAEGPIDRRARSERAVAAIRMLPTRNGVEVWTADETSGRSLLRQAIVDDKPGGPDHTLIVLQTAEVLRTSLFPHPAPEPAPIVIQVAPPPPERSKIALSAAVGPLYGFGGSGPAWQGWVSLQHLWTECLGAAVAVSAPLRRETVAGPEGTSDVGAVTVGAELVARFTSSGRRAFASAAAGAAFLAVLSTGHPSASTAPLVGSSSSAYTAIVQARGAVGWKLSPRLAVGVNALAGTTVARVHLRFAGNEAATWGTPLLGAALFGEVEWR